MSRYRKLLLLAAVLVAIFAALQVYAHVNRRGFTRTYFRLENAWVDHYPFQRGKWEVRNLVPLLCRLGLLAPVRIQVEPGISYLLDPLDLVSVSILRGGEWQPEIWESILPALSEGSVFLDVGAHIGYFSMKAAAKVGKTGRVVAFEPNPDTLEFLRSNVTANRAENVIVQPIACTDREQTLTLYAAPEINTGASSLTRDNANISAAEAPKAFSVRGRPIDDVVRELNLTRVDAIKVDVEGAEVSVLRGAAETLRRFHPKLVVEVIPEQLAGFKTTPAELEALIKASGYNRAKPLNPEQHDWEWTLLEPGRAASTIRMADPSTAGQLLRGFHGVEQNAWRWTAGRFTAALRPPAGAEKSGAWLVLKFLVPEASLRKLKNITVQAKIGSAAMAPETIAAPGAHEYRRDVPASALGKEIVEADFVLDRFLSPAEADGRELGVVVTSVGLEGK